MASVLHTLKKSISLKLLIIIFITILMLIPLSMVESTIYERSGLRTYAEQQISERWGGRQTIAPPILVVPYKEKVVVDLDIKDGWLSYDKKPPSKKITYIDHTAYILADKSVIHTKMTTETRYLGIYEVPVYVTTATIQGGFKQTDLEKLKQNYSQIEWNNVRMILPIRDVRGIRSISHLSISGLVADFIPLSQQNSFTKGVEVPLDLSDKLNEDLKFNLDIKLSGSREIDFLPLARSTKVQLNSDWHSPGFGGAYLPVNRQISSSGFSAEWNVLSLNRSFGQMWKDNELNAEVLHHSAFGVELYQPADIYQQNTRSVKYAELFIALTFMAFFLFEVFYKLRLHPLQYFFTGGALSTFYLLLLALSEHINFSLSYLFASIAIVILLSVYSIAILKQRGRGLLVGGITATIYAFLYFLIQSEQSSLLFGAIGFFAVLSTIMYLTRHIDWYNISNEKVAE